MGYWERLAIAEADCPRCGAGRGARCRTGSGRTAKSPHARRYAAAMNAVREADRRASEGSETSQ